MLHAIQQHRAAAREDIVELGGAFVVMQFGPIDVHGMRPGGRGERRVFVTDKAIPPAAGAALSWRVAFMTDEQRTGRWWSHER